jgi:hypothetical protein
VVIYIHKGIRGFNLIYGKKMPLFSSLIFPVTIAPQGGKVALSALLSGTFFS